MSPKRPLFLIGKNVDSEDDIEALLRQQDIAETIICRDATRSLSYFQTNKIEMALFDVSTSKEVICETLETIRAAYPRIPVIVVSDAAHVETAVQCIKSGAFDFVLKPLKPDILTASIKRAMKVRDLEGQTHSSSPFDEGITNLEDFAHLVTRSPKILKIFKSINAIAQTQRSVLITGETGVGKELIGQVIHKISKRPGLFFPVNIAGLDDNLFSDTLFGHVKGAYTGAATHKKGVVELAVRGTVFMDEIGDMNPASQVKLLRFLQEKEYLPLGAEKHKTADVRIVAATNRDLWESQKLGKFRADLNYRLRTHHIHLPPLRERREDLPLLVDHFLEKSARELNKKKPGVPRELVDLLETYAFPGNIRELESMVFDAVSHHQSKLLSLEIFKKHVQRRKKVYSHGIKAPLTFHETLPSLKLATQLLIEEAMSRTNNNQSIAANMLGISQSALSRRLKKT